MNDKLQSKVTLEDTLPPVLIRWDEEDAIIIHYMSRSLKDLYPYKVHGSNEVSSYAIKECAEKPDRPIEIQYSEN